MLEKTVGAIKNEQSRDAISIENKTQYKDNNIGKDAITEVLLKVSLNTNITLTHNFP